MRAHLTTLFMTALLGSCVAEPAGLDREAGPLEGLDDAGAVSPEGTSLNGTSLNGTSLNGTSLNGTSLSGLNLEGVKLGGGVTLGGAALSAVTLSATGFTGKKPDGTTITGAGFVGAQFSGHLSNGSTVALRVDSRVALGGANADVYAYGVSFQTTAGWSPLCGKDAGGVAILAVPLGGTWNYAQGVANGGAFTADATRFTFACRTTAIAKCVELGYKPWKSTAGGVSLQGHHLACIRMLRADFCGNGTSYTVDGTPINLYDNVGVQADTQPWYIEAEWSPSGARFASRKSETRLALTMQRPPCFSSIVSDTTGQLAHFAGGTLIMNEYKQ
jgi:hypothetical protein